MHEEYEADCLLLKALEVKEPPERYWSIVNLLAKLVRARTRLPAKGQLYAKQSLAPDVEGWLKAIGKRDINLDKGLLDLSQTNFRAADLRGLDLSRIKLQEADLSSAVLNHAALSNADLQDTNLSGASLCRTKLMEAECYDACLIGTDLSHADVRNASLNGADLRRANLTGAKLCGANLNKADLEGVNFHGADLQDANLTGASGLTTDQIQVAKNWEGAHYDPNFRQALGLPTV